MKISPRLKFFFQPLVAHSRNTAVAVAVSILQGLLAPATARFFATATQALETQTPQLFWNSFWIFLSYLSFVFVFKRIFVHNGIILMNEIIKRTRHHIHQKIFLMENTATESLGTGRIQSIADDGTRSRVQLLQFFVRRIPRTFVTIVGAFILVRHASPQIF